MRITIPPAIQDCSSKNLQYARVAINGNSSLYGRYQSTVTFRKKWFNYNDLPQDIKQNPFPTSLHCPNASFSCASLRLHTQVAKGGAATVACFEALHMARGLECQIFAADQENVSAVRALRQTGRESPRKNCLVGLLFSHCTCLDLGCCCNLDGRVQCLCNHETGKSGQV
jgi:hypothetical protein